MSEGKRGKWVVALGVALAVVVADQLTKAVIDSRMHLHQSVALIDGFFSLTYIRNTGAAFGMLSGRWVTFRVPFFVAVSAVAVGVLVWFLRGLPAERRWVAAACGGVIGGAVGNMIDRITLGEVIDFLDVYVGSYHWPAFNFADMGITVGVAVLCLDALRRPATSARLVV